MHTILYLEPSRRSRISAVTANAGDERGKRRSENESLDRDAATQARSISPFLIKLGAGTSLPI